MPRTLFSRLGFDLPTRARLGDLSMARRQMVEIARAIGYDSHILIMDEPTSALGETETRVLFAAIEKLKRLNVGIIYVSHRLNELAQIADDYTIFRDGRFIQTGAMADLTRDELVRLIVGTGAASPSTFRPRPRQADRRGFGAISSG